MPSRPQILYNAGFGLNPQLIVGTARQTITLIMSYISVEIHFLTIKNEMLHLLNPEFDPIIASHNNITLKIHI